MEISDSAQGLKRVWLAAALYWVLASALTCLFYPLTMADACARYAPMADAFARGDFYYAFHPRFGLIFEVLSGVLTFVTGLPGVYTVQITAFLFLALTGVVMFAFVRRLGAREEVAWWTFVLVLLAPDFFRYALDGLRETGKCLVFALVAFAVVSKCGAAFALALFLYITLFTYGFGAASVLLFLWSVWFLWHREPSRLALPIVGWALGTAVVTVFTHAYTGHWVPAPQFISLLGAWL